MQLGAVVVVPSDAGLTQNFVPSSLAVTATRSKPRPAICSPRASILGNDALSFWADRVRTLGIKDFWLARTSQDSQALHARFLELTKQGVEKLLLIKLQSYAEMDLMDLLRFHCANRSPLTDAKDKRGSLGVSLLDRSAVSDCIESDASDKPCAAQYHFDGYTKRFLLSQERQDLIRDGLAGICAIKPRGKLIRDGVWIADDAKVDESVRIVGPAFIGPRSVIRSGATIGPFTSVEPDCVIDGGTTITKSSVLPGTYLAPGILVEESVVSGKYLEDLRWGVHVDLAPARLARRISARSRWAHKLRSTPSEVSQDYVPSHSTSGGAPSWVRVNL